MKTKCYSVRLKSLVDFSSRSFKATAFDGSTAIIPKSQVFGQDYDVEKCDAYWIAAFVLEDPVRMLQFSDKKQAIFNPDTGQMQPVIIIQKHIPKKINPINYKPIKELQR